MLAIVFSHVLFFNDLSRGYWLYWHVPGFLIISGFFGLRASLSKVIKLLLTVYLCYWLTIPVHGDVGINLIFPHGGWFVPFYVVLMIMSPILNAAIKDRTQHRAILVSVVVMLFFAWVPLWVPRLSMMKVSGLQGRGMLLMMATYLLSRLSAEYGVARKLKGRTWGLLFVGMIILLWLIYGNMPATSGYVAPPSIFTAFCGFAFFSNLELPARLSRVICFISPSMFSVYVLHNLCVGSWQCSQFAKESVVHGFLWSVGLFAVCLLIDMIRRLIFYAVEKFILRKTAARF